MKSNITKTLLALTLLAGGLASCSLDEQEIPAEELYTREFYKTFGTNWSPESFNVVDQKSVTLNCSQPTHVKIYELQDGEYRLAADWEDVTQKTITFDGMKNDNSPFLVQCDDAVLCASNGGTVNYNPQGSSAVTKASAKVATRSSAIPDEYSSIVKKSTNYTQLTCSDGDKTLKTLNEKDGQENPAGVIIPGNQYIVVNANDAFTFYPVYWNSTKKHTVGIYYSDSKNELHTIPVYTDHEGDELQFKVNDNWQTTLENTNNCWSYGDNQVQFTDDFTFQAKGYTVTADMTVAAGIYVQIGDKIYYSDANLNGGKKFFAYKDLHQGDEGYTYFMFDDPDDSGNEGDRDFNDLVILTKNNLKQKSETTMGWTVACEDLGGTFDYDFNDVVFQVYYVSGQDWIRIIPLAAGGTLPVKLYYYKSSQRKDVLISNGEWHNHFGATEGTYKSTDMINTCYGGADYERHVLPIYVKTGNKNFSMAEYAINNYDDAGNLMIKVQRPDSEEPMECVIGPSNGKAPQVLVLPTTWRWPKELKRINTIYTGFGTWGENYKGKTWINTNLENTDQLTEDEFYLHVIGRQSYEPRME